MTALELKQYIYDYKKIEDILEDLGCTKIVFHQDKEIFSACQPDGDNLMGVVIKNCPNLNYYSYSRNIHIEDSQDILNLIQDIKHLKFSDTIKYVCSLLGLEYKYSSSNKEIKPKFDLCAIFKKANRRKRICNVADLKDLEEGILDDYFSGLHISWIRQGIMPWTAKKFGLCYSYKQKRQIIPIRYWEDGSLVATNARTVIDNYDLFDLKKYYISKGYNKSVNIYGLWENKKDIEKKGYCVLYEAEKSVLKRDSLNDPTGLALQGHSISEKQVTILKGLELHEIVIALDKDVPIEEVWSICDRLYNKINVSYIWDKYDLLGAKDSPADAPNQIYNFLFKHRVKYDEDKHDEYMRILKN